MDSIPGEDPTLPLEINSGLNFSRLPDVSGDEVRNQVGGGGALPEVAEETVSPSRARTMKDFENQITELRKENFNLKLRIYFLEDRIQQKFDDPHDDVYRINIELKVELESVKRELQQREQLLRKASKAVESLAQGGDAEIQRLKEDAEKKLQEVETSLTSRIQLLEEDLQSAREEVEKAFASTERERVQRLAVEQQLSLIITAQAKDNDVTALLGEKDRCIEQLRLSLERKNAEIQLLEEGQGRASEESQDPGVALNDEKERTLEILRTEFSSEKKDLEKRIECLQENLRERETELSAEKKNALKRDKTIQGLTLVLKTKENETGELASEVESLKALLAKSGEIGSEAQMQKFKEAEGPQELLMEKESLLADLRSQNLTKDTENRKLQRKLKRIEQELSELLTEKEKLAGELEEARQQKNQSDKTIHDLRNQLEKTQNELAEKEKAIELHYQVLLGEEDQRLQNQELVIARLTDGVAQKDELLQTLDGVIREKDLRLQEWSTKFQNLEKNKESLERQNEALIEEKCAAQSEQLVTKMMHELERIKESEYSEMLETLRKEHTIFASLIRSLKDADGINNLQEELNTILALRKQLEEGILETWNLRRTLEEQIRDNRKEEDTLISWSNQTSYMSICLRDQDYRLDCPVDQLSMEELKKKFVEVLGVVKEMHWVIQELKKKPFDFSTSDPSGNEKQKSLDTSELLERTEESQTLLGASDEEASAPSCDGPETLSEIILLDPLDQPYKTLNPPEFEPEPVAGKYFEGSPAADNGDSREETPSPVCLPDENGAAELESRSGQRPSKAANEPLDPEKISERGSLSDDLENKEEGDLKQLIIQLRAELEQLMQTNISLKQQGEPQPTPGTEDPESTSESNMETESSKVEVKDTATQTITGPGAAAWPKHEGKKTPVSEDAAAPQSSRFDQDCLQRYVSGKSDPQKAPLQVSKANKSNSCYQPKKSRLPVLLKASRSLGSISLMSPLSRPDQDCVFTLDQGPKGRQWREEAQQSEAEGHGSLRKDVREEDKQAEVSAIQPKIFEADLNLPGIQSAGQRDQDRRISNPTQIETDRSKPSSSPELRSPLSVPEKQYGDAVSASLGGKKSVSFKQSLLSFEAFDCESVSDIEDLRQRIRDLKSVVEKYQVLLIHFNLIEPPPSGDPLDPVGSDGESPTSLAGFKESEPELASFSNEMQPKEGAEDSSGSGPSNNQTVQKLQELLSENEAELEKEQMANMKLVDEVHRLHDKLKSLAPRDEPDFSVGLLLPEESPQRQKIHESHNICATYRQHLSNLIRAFEDLLRDSEVDYYIAESFREQLNQSAQIFERLEHQCLYGDSIDDEMTRLCNLAQSLSDFEVSQHLPSPEGPTHGEEEAENGKEKPTATPSKFPPELLMEHLQEIRLLRQRLEDSIKTNEHLRKHLEQQVSASVPDQDVTNAHIRASEQLNSLTSEIHFLRKQNQTLNGMLEKGSRGLEAQLAEKQKENEALRESLTQKLLAVEGLQKDHEHLEKENEKLREQVEKGEVENEGLTHELYEIRIELNRLQMELATKHHQLTESDKLLCSLRVELKVYEKLDEALQKAKDRRQNEIEECTKDQNQPLDLGELLTEIQFLRKQLEQSIASNQMLHEKVEEQLRLGQGEKESYLGSAVQISYLFGHESQQLPTGIKELSFSTLDSPSHCSLLTNQEICPIPSHCVWADKNGQHILGLIEDYNCLRKQITEGRKRLSKLELPLREEGDPELAVTVPLSLSATFKAVQENLEEAGRLLTLLWRVSLPMKVVHAAAYSLQDEDLKSEVYKLRRKVTEQEKKLFSMARRLYSTNQLKENMERVIMEQLSLTHSVLKKARANLEVHASVKKAAASSLIKKRV
ncbi:CDK5 regulatory subunit-associated protein 2 isoform X3 [Thamnophis elegans]|uniref:CDK5 regulatory subunit-associated protein 2 isoform X3 n=1 Tax=Thamnophis elegans TaxID=35005 RepID=UPI00137654FB|nr:CDK5 regulatory subunit-associated protein 2 isoform X3 [Thamnophis elegans]